MNKLFSILIVLVLPIALPAQFVFKNIAPSQLPTKIVYKGEVRKSVTWSDSLGKHFILLTEEGPIKSMDKKDSLGFCEEEDCKDKFLYAYHFIQNKDSISTLWKMHDFVKQCSFDLYAAFEIKSLSITDLNKNSIPEVWFIYKTTCTSDVSPRSMKLFMFEGSKKHIIRGLSKTKISATDFTGGEKKFDSNFNTTNQLFKDFAVRLWDKFVMDSYN